MAMEPDAPARTRIVSVDALRGFVMAGMIVTYPLIPAIQSLPPGARPEVIRQQFYHSAWHGLTCMDLRFAGFVMIMGLAVRLSPRTDKSAPPFKYYEQVTYRAVAIFFIGFLYNGGFSEPWPDIRLSGVLQRMAICYFAAAVIYRYTEIRGRIILGIGILLLYWGILALVPVPGGQAGDYSFQGNLAAWLDAQFLPGRLYYGTWDPEGILSTFPAIASAIAGLLWGDLLFSNLTSTQKLFGLLVAGLVSLNIGIIWDLVFPINKPLWTSSYVLVTAGIGSLCLAFFYYFIDILQWKVLFTPLVVIGRNLLLTFVLVEVVPFDSVALRLVGGDVALVSGRAAPFVQAGVEILLLWGILYYLYRQRLYIRL